MSNIIIQSCTQKKNERTDETEHNKWFHKFEFLKHKFHFFKHNLSYKNKTGGQLDGWKKIESNLNGNSNIKRVGFLSSHRSYETVALLSKAAVTNMCARSDFETALIYI